MDQQEVIQKKKPILARRAPKAPAPAKPWRQTAPYIFMGAVFFLGLAALFLVMHGRLDLAGRIILLAVVLAGSEYPFRRFSAGPSSLENEFSTLSDILCFAVVPGFLVYQLAFRGWGILGLVALFVIVFAAVLRLSLYKVFNPMSPRRGFVGLPLTMNAAFISLVAQLVTPGHLLPVHRLGLMMILMVLAFLTVSPIRYPDPADWPGVLVLSVMAVAAIFLGPIIAEAAVWVLLAGGAGYIAFAPFLVKKGGLHHA